MREGHLTRALSVNRARRFLLYYPSHYSGVQAEGYTLSRKARIKPFNTFSVSTTLGSSGDESFNRRLKLKTKIPQSIYLSSYQK